MSIKWDLGDSRGAVPHLPDVNDLAVMWYPRKDVFVDAAASFKINSYTQNPIPDSAPQLTAGVR